MKKISLTLPLFFSFLLSYGQYGYLESPQLWLRADTLSAQDSAWRDITNNGHDAFFLEGTPEFADRKLNFHNALQLSGTGHMVIPSYHFTNKEFTVIIVYSVPDSLDECGLWQVERDSTVLGLSTQHMLSENREIRYIDSNRTGVIINTLSQHWQNLPLVGVVNDVQIGFGDDFDGAVAEFLLFDKKLPKEQVIGWASYLAVKYGVTLYDMPYFSSDSITVWDNSQEFSSTIFGLGRDIKTGLHQRQSEALDGQIIIGITSPVSCNETHSDIIAEGDYLLWGLDDSGLTNAYELALFDDITVTAHVNGLLQRTGITSSTYPTFLQIDASQWQSPKADYKLLIDRSGFGEFNDFEIYEPDMITPDSILYFSNVYWDVDNNGFDRFCFAILPEILPRSFTSGENADDNGVDDTDDIKSETCTTPSGNRYELYPNPTRGSYTVDVSLQAESTVEVSIYTSDGKLLRREVKTCSSACQFSGFVTTSGNYIVDIRSAGENKVFKLIVQ